MQGWCGEGILVTLKIKYGGFAYVGDKNNIRQTELIAWWVAMHMNITIN